MSRLAADRNQRLLLELVSKPGNDICADCKARNPRWASFNLGIFICVSCASIHRKIGTHVSKVKSITLDSWTKEQVDNMKEMGNVKSNAIYNPNEVRNPPPPRLDDPSRDNDLEQYIRSKYEHRRFIDKKAFVASRLGPSRSASSVTPRTNSSYTHVSEKPGSAPPEPSTATDIAATMFPTTNSQFQSRTTVSSKPFPSSASHPVASMSSTPTRSEGVWADLISLQGPSTNASLPLQYQAPATNLSGTTIAAGMYANPYNNVTGLSPAGSFHQQPFAANMLMQQPLGLHSSLTPSTSGPSFQSTSPMTPSNFGPPGSSPLFQMQVPPQTSPAVPFYQPQPSFLSIPQQPQFLSSSPNNSPNLLFPSPSPQLLSTAQQPISALNVDTRSNVGMGGSTPEYLVPGFQPIVNGAHGQGHQAPIMPNTKFGNGSVTLPSMNSNPFGQFIQAGFAAQNAGHWGLS